MGWDKASFVEKLEDQHSFPGAYTFKFIVKKKWQPVVEALVLGANVVSKESSEGTYVSVTIKAEMPSSGSVIEVYERAAKIEGCIAL